HLEGAHDAAIDEDERIDERDQHITDGGPHQRGAYIGRALGLIRRARKIEGDRVTLLLHHDMNTNRPVQLYAVVVDKALRFETPIGPIRNRAAHFAFGHIEQALEAGKCSGFAKFPDERADALFAEPARAKLTP